MRKLLATLLLLFVVTPFAFAADLQSQLLDMEKAQWAAWGKKDGESFKKVLTKDAVVVVAGSKPVAGRDAIIKDINTLPCELKSFSFADEKLKRLAPNIVILSYTATQDATCEGKKMPPKVHATAVYVRQRTWLQTYYQETPID